MDCEKCRTVDHPFSCIICEHPNSLESMGVWSIEYICMIVVGMKVCAKHAKELDDLQQKREIERAVA